VKQTLITTNNSLARRPLDNISKYCDLREYRVLCDINVVQTGYFLIEYIWNRLHFHE